MGTFFSFKASPLEIQIPADEYPVDAVEFIRVNRIGGNVFAWFNWGEMCIKELAGVNKVFIDGRYETVYSEDLIDRYFASLHCRVDYNKFLDSFPETDIMFLEYSKPILMRLYRDKSWVIVYASPVAVILLKDNRHNAEAIKKFRDKRLAYPEKARLYYFK